ncbi:MAG TPA: PIN domain-containing protein [Acidobacteriota bacterium]|nr:PIN domain-containing protein [Acidobacteriota bacterium]
MKPKGERPKGLIDSGAILALVDETDQWHEVCDRELDSLSFPLATTTAVLCELFHFIKEKPVLLEAAWEVLRSGAVTVLPLSDEDLIGIEVLMARYQDRPMDFADATLVHLARRENLKTIFTTDHNDFETYRIKGKSAFRVRPPRQGQ